jgi:aminoglycoside 3-N-acetyltransferase
MSYHYNYQDLKEAFIAIGLKKGDLVFSHSNIGYFGIIEGEKSVDNAFNTILNALFDVIGETGTLVVPTFTYSFSQGQIFDYDQTQSDCGIFTEKLRNLPQSYRSEDPNVSVTAIGYLAKEITENIPENTYGENSFFARFYQRKGVICNLNFDAGSTFIHYVERCLNVPYRFDKTFTGIFIKNGIKQEKKSTIWVRYLSNGTSAKFEIFDRLAKQQHLYKTAQVGRGFVGVITAEDTFNLIKNTLPSRPWFLTEAELLNITPDLSHETQ